MTLVYVPIPIIGRSQWPKFERQLTLGWFLTEHKSLSLDAIIDEIKAELEIDKITSLKKLKQVMELLERTTHCGAGFLAAIGEDFDFPKWTSGCKHQ